MQRTTSRLILRPPHSDDLASVFAIHSDPATNQYNPAGPMTDISQAASVLGDWLRHWEEKGFGQWAIASRDDPQNIIGFGGLSMRMYLEVERLNLGYRFAVVGWGKGYATELSIAALEFGFKEWAWSRFTPWSGPRIWRPSGCWKRSVCSVLTHSMMCRGKRRAWCTWRAAPELRVDGIERPWREAIQTLASTNCPRANWPTIDVFGRHVH